MRIITVNDFGYIDGGASAVAINSACQIAQLEGFESFFFCGEGPVDKALIEMGVEVCCLELPSLLNNPSKVKAAITGISNRKVEIAFREFLSSFDKIDTIIHIHTWTKVLSSIVFKVATQGGFATIVTCHDYFSVCPNGAFYNYRKKAFCECQPLRCKCFITNCDKRSYSQKIWRSLRQVVQNKRLKNCRLISYVYVSDFCKKIIDKYVSSTSNWVVENPIYQYEINSKRSMPSYFIFVGRLSVEKGADLFCEACTALKENGIVIGDGELLHELAARYPDIDFKGWLSPNEIETYVANAYALVYPSRVIETDGLTVREFLKAGIPCVTFRGCAASSRISEGVNGVIANQYTVDCLKTAMENAKTISHFSIDSNVDCNGFYSDNLKKIYKQLL